MFAAAATDAQLREAPLAETLAREAWLKVKPAQKAVEQLSEITLHPRPQAATPPRTPTAPPPAEAAVAAAAAGEAATAKRQPAVAAISIGR